MPMNDSKMTDDWIAKVVAANPFRIAEKTGNIITCPVRLQFVNFLQPAKPMEGSDPDKKPSYNCVVCLPPGAEHGWQNLLWPMVYAEERKHFPNNFGPDNRSFGLHSPFRDQIEKSRNSKGETVLGFTPGLQCFSASTLIKPMVTDTAGNPIVDESRIYPGMWAILAVNLYPYGIKPVRPKKGINFGLQNVMFFADDTKTGGGGKVSNPKDDFSGVNIDHAYRPEASFGNTPAAPVYAPPAPGSIMPPAQPVAPGYAPPAQWTPPPVAPAAPAAPQSAEDFF